MRTFLFKQPLILNEKLNKGDAHCYFSNKENESSSDFKLEHLDIQIEIAQKGVTFIT